MKPKTKKCKFCQLEFIPERQFQSVCSAQCAWGQVNERNRKKIKKADRKRKQELKTNGELLREAQREFNAYIRLRDHGKNCISCGRQPNYKATIGGSGVQAGHYRSVGSCPELRFEELNVHIQCFRCNSMESGNLIAYRRGLVEKIGVDRVEWLEGPHEPKKYTREQIIEIKKKYSKMRRELEKLINS